jgi:hypothetical protein
MDSVYIECNSDQAALKSFGDEVLVSPNMTQAVMGLGFEVQWALGRIHLRVLLLPHNTSQFVKQRYLNTKYFESPNLYTL